MKGQHLEILRTARGTSSLIAMKRRVTTGEIVVKVEKVK